MPAYRQDLSRVYGMTFSGSLGCFLVAAFNFFFCNGLAWAFRANGLEYLIPLLAFLYYLVIYLLLPFLIVLILVKVSLKLGGGAMLFAVLVLAFQFAFLFIIASLIASFFIHWADIWQLLKGPMYVTIDFS
ncbi:MAG: hypothetical protein UV78_C0030G0013 [Parcubacteria group bacterium GW2011_GWA2_43_17]|nr:MAG: hypothetical protein UV78_C0030G0013 [Parcubacteria group bacterium GW2011_GWA2_43_17]KKT92866.1 MAG: hypothetical protein UW91_C0015G0037 [Parcubacteria group bacterium GW2011_GWF2_45_11]KKT96910.1 MAG: hypothetical protein UW98_C0031G0009 [Parcubacteria group bacterium GW2011_GWC2_45_15]OGY93274.1 MAG: hypothetical protein A2260_02855 [Candidatus Komeilibacteria bacterium RIFOXYA2_FULL_45_9]OGY95926.1 MAG: hypothetical protein A3J95_00420 [Candidatus Komeilibacteria bacterium RIFOXYC2